MIQDQCLTFKILNLHLLTLKISGHVEKQQQINSTDQVYCLWQRRRQVPFTGEVNNSPSLTIPDQSQSLETLLDRYTTGQAVPLYKPVYNESFTDQIERMDPVERIVYARELKSKSKELETLIKTQKDRADKAPKFIEPQPTPAQPNEPGQP